MLLRYPPPVCQEEEGESPGGLPGGWSRGLSRSRSRDVAEDREQQETIETTQERVWSEKAFLRVMEEREKILASDKLSARQKRQLLETSRYPLAVVTDRGVPFRTEEVVRWMLIYSMVVVLILALLTAFAHLEKEVTISFVGTVIGGMIATVAQKLGKIGK